MCGYFVMLDWKQLGTVYFVIEIACCQPSVFTFNGFLLPQPLIIKKTFLLGSVSLLTRAFNYRKRAKSGHARQMPTEMR